MLPSERFRTTKTHSGHVDAFDVGEGEVQGIISWRHPFACSHKTPMRRVSTVSGAPTFAYSQKPIVTPRARATCTTMRLATDPTRVRLPARVDDMATVSQTRCGSGRFATNGLRTSSPAAATGHSAAE